MGTQIQAPFKRLIGENGELTRGVPVAQKNGQVSQYFLPREKTEGKAWCVGKRQWMSFGQNGAWELRDSVVLPLYLKTDVPVQKS